MAEDFPKLMSHQPTRIVALSSTAFGHRCLKEGVLPTPGMKLTGILTTASQIDISYSEQPVKITTHAAFDDLAGDSGCEVVELRGRVTSRAILKHLDQWQPDLLVALGWYYMVSQQVREKAPLGCIGIHASLLPKYRGGAPIPWAIINSEAETGITLFYLAEGVDSGDIIAQSRFSIEEKDTCATVYEKATQASIDVLREYLPQIAAGTAPRIAQQESEAEYFPQRKPEDGLIDWSWSPRQIKDFIRAQTRPYPGAFTYIEGKKVIIWDADVLEAES